MSYQPRYWPAATFDAIGDSPAVNLTEHLPPEEPANALLLGCGDPRSILFTISSRGVHFKFDLDFTCCDIESAILARNVLLLTMLADGTTVNNVWNAFYHLNLDSDSYYILLEQSRKLAALSESIEKWNGGPYGYFLRICTRLTLVQLRRHWEAYSASGKLSRSQRKRVGARFKAAMAEAREMDGIAEGINVDAAYSAGPLYCQAVDAVPAAYANYWKTGTTSPSAVGISGAFIPNPTLRSAHGRALAMPCTLDPMRGYHIATAFALLKDAEAPASGVEEGFGHIVAAARREFAEWAKAFRDALTGDGCRVVIRIFSGDAVAFCKALHHRQASGSTESGYYSAPWMGHRLVLDGGDYDEGAVSKAPLMFNVIDTSTLAGRLGHLNILILATPLLVRSPSATLYTETMLHIEENPVESFTVRIGGDIPAISLLFDLLPLSYATNFNTHSNAYESRSSVSYGALGRLFRERMAWKSVSLGDSIAAERGPPCGGLLEYHPLQLAKFMLGVYNLMFLLKETTDDHLVHYTYGTFAILLRLVKDRVQTNWPEFITNLMDGIGQSSGGFQELVTQLHIAGVMTCETPPNYPHKLGTRPSTGIFRGWQKVPPVVCVVLSVPREEIERLSRKPKGRVILARCKTEKGILAQGKARGALTNSYSCVHPAFGTVKKEADGRVVLESDPEGWAGTSPLVLSFLVPARSLMAHPGETSISFEVPTEMYGTPLKPAEFSASLTGGHVYVTPEWPNIPCGVETFEQSSFGRAAPAQSAGEEVVVGPVCVNLDEACKKVETLTVRLDIAGEVTKSEFGGGAMITCQQISPCTILLAFGSINQYLVFPFPVNGGQVRISAARKSLWIKVTAPIRGPLSPDGHSIKKFPVLSSPIPTCWNIPYLALARLPALKLTKRSILTESPGLTWLANHFDLVYADREVIICNRRPRSGLDLIIDVKETICHLIANFAGLGGLTVGLFELMVKDGASMIIFPTDLRLDLASHTVVLDCCVMPVTKAATQSAARLLRNPRGVANKIVLSSREYRAWNDLIPAFVERCRTWKHSQTCEYKTNGIPASDEQTAGSSPLCSCALGNPSEEFMTRGEWRPLAQYVTRAAISPLFAVPWLEAVGYLEMLKGFAIYLGLDKLARATEEKEP